MDEGINKEIGLQPNLIGESFEACANKEIFKLIIKASIPVMFFLILDVTSYTFNVRCRNACREILILPGEFPAAELIFVDPV